MTEVKPGILNGGRGSGQTVRRITAIYEEKIADLKANFDYVLEGKDLEIKELKDTDEYIIKTLESKVEKLQEDLRNKRISIKNKKAENKLLGERCNQLLKDKGNLTDELQELKDHLAEEVNLHLHAEDYIKSLEKENAELRNNGFTVSAMTEQQLKVAIEKGEQLEKENAELELKYLRATDEGTSFAHLKSLEGRLTQAKKIIKGLLSCCRNYPQENAEKIKQAEQFLKEIEK